jgi:hypothetical protein
MDQSMCRSCCPPKVLLYIAHYFLTKIFHPSTINTHPSPFHIYDCRVGLNLLYSYWWKLKNKYQKLIILWRFCHLFVFWEKKNLFLFWSWGVGFFFFFWFESEIRRFRCFRDFACLGYLLTTLPRLHRCTLHCFLHRLLPANCRLVFSTAVCLPACSWCSASRPFEWVLLREDLVKKWYGERLCMLGE